MHKAIIMHKVLLQTVSIMGRELGKLLTSSNLKPALSQPGRESVQAGYLGTIIRWLSSNVFFFYFSCLACFSCFCYVYVNHIYRSFI